MENVRFTKYIFDFDGTIMDTKEDVWVSIGYACTRSGYELHDDFRSNPVNLSLSIREIFEIVSSGEDPDGFENFNSLLTHHYRELNDFRFSCLYAHMDQLLSFLTETGRTRIIVSNKPLPPLLKILDRHNLTRSFDAVHSTDTPASPSIPKSSILKQIAQGQPEDCVYIGDSFTDVLASKENHIFSVGVLYGDGDQELLKNARPDYLVSSSAELFDLVISWESSSNASN